MCVWGGGRVELRLEEADCDLGLESQLESRPKAARYGLEVSAGWASSSSAACGVETLFCSRPAQLDTENEVVPGC
jgi:hypothetical protein